MTTAHRAWIAVVRSSGPLLLAGALFGAVRTGVAAPGPVSTLAPWTAVTRLPAAGEYRYTLTARVRPLLVFWISRPNVGIARIVRGQTSDGGRGYELLIGSIPDKCPMRLNRWGYVAESTQGERSQLIGLMTESNEDTVEQASAVLKENARAKHVFKAIRASIANGEASAQVVRAAFDEEFTLRDVASVLARLPEGGEPTSHVAVPPNASPGFLAALARLLHTGAVAFRTSGQPSGRRQSQSFVYDRAIYDLTMKSSKLVPQVPLSAGAVLNCLDSEFEIRNRTTNDTTAFRLTYATEGALAEVPLRIVYRPRWWFEADLTLEAWK